MLTGDRKTYQTKNTDTQTWTYSMLYTDTYTDTNTKTNIHAHLYVSNLPIFPDDELLPVDTWP